MITILAALACLAIASPALAFFGYVARYDVPEWSMRLYDYPLAFAPFVAVVSALAVAGPTFAVITLIDPSIWGL